MHHKKHLNLIPLLHLYFPKAYGRKSNNKIPCITMKSIKQIMNKYFENPRCKLKPYYLIDR